MKVVTQSTYCVCAGLFVLFTTQGHADAPSPDVAPPPAVSSDMELIRTIIAHNTAARERIYSLPLRVQLESETTYDYNPAKYAAPIADIVPKGRRTDRSESVKIYDGPRFKSSVVKTYSVSDADFHRVQEILILLNEEYFAEVYTFHDKNGVPYMSIELNEHRANGEVLDATNEVVKGWKEPDVRKFGFGIGGSRTLQKLLESHPDNSTWTADDLTRDTALLKLTYLGRPDSQLRRTKGEFWLDPAKDFLVVRADLVAREGYDRENIQVDLMELPGGIWFPREVTIDHRELNGRSYKQHIKVLSAEVNVTPPHQDFYLESLTFDPARTRLYRHSPDGTVTEMLLYAGQWVPKDVVPPEASPHIR